MNKPTPHYWIGHFYGRYCLFYGGKPPNDWGASAIPKTKRAVGQDGLDCEFLTELSGRIFDLPNSKKTLIVTKLKLRPGARVYRTSSFMYKIWVGINQSGHCADDWEANVSRHYHLSLNRTMGAKTIQLKRQLVPIQDSSDVMIPLVR